MLLNYQWIESSNAVPQWKTLFTQRMKIFIGTFLQDNESDFVVLCISYRKHKLCLSNYISELYECTLAAIAQWLFKGLKWGGSFFWTFRQYKAPKWLCMRSQAIFKLKKTCWTTFNLINTGPEASVYILLYSKSEHLRNPG